jgi:hypothetical protein
MDPNESKRRKIKPFPPELEEITNADRKSFILALEVDTNPKSKRYNQELLVAQSVKVSMNGVATIVVHLKGIVVDHLRRLAKNLGVLNCGSLNKYDIRRAIASHVTDQESREEKRRVGSSRHASRITNTVCRAVNVIFSEQFMDELPKTAKGDKSRRDHEARNMCEDFWIRASLAHNSIGSAAGRNIAQIKSSNDGNGADEEGDGEAYSSCKSAYDLTQDIDDRSNNEIADSTSDPFITLVIPDDVIHFQELVKDQDINLSVVTQLTTDAFRNMIRKLFKMRRIMKQEMTVSGTHDSDPWSFVERAMSAHDSSGITKISLYYFFVRCEAIPGIDESFHPLLGPACVGASADCVTEDASSLSQQTGSYKKQRTQQDAILDDMVDQGKALLNYLREASEDRKAAAADRRLGLQLLQQKNKFHARLEVAKALGDTEELRKLMEEARSM